MTSGNQLNNSLTEINPLSPTQVTQLVSLLSELTSVQQAWVSGYLAANANMHLTQAAPAMRMVTSAAPSAPLTILYGSQTGNAKSLAHQIEANAKARQMPVRVLSMSDYKPAQLKTERYMVLVVSTYGEGEPPEPAVSFFEYLQSKKVPKLNDLKFATLGLGDSSYEFFCQSAIDFEELLIKNGAQATLSRAELDVDYDEQAAQWISQAVELFEPELQSQEQSTPIQAVNDSLSPVSSGVIYSKQSPFNATILEVQKITGRESTRDVRHVEISLEESGITYQPGDSLGIFFKNDPTTVDSLLAQVGIDRKAPVQLGDKEMSIKEALTEHLELTQSYPGFIEKYAKLSNDPTLLALIDNKDAMRKFIEPRQIFDIIRQHPASLKAQDLVNSLRKSQPRLYSIASSQAEADDAVHLTVAVLEFEAFGRKHFGGCSSYLGLRTEADSEVRVFVESNDSFRLPESDDTPIIMIGAGTGVAPFRAFLQERDTREATGDNWLIFGNPHFTQDFLYQTEMQGYIKSNLLTRMDVAFSRDQEEKVYVQDEIIRNGKLMTQWLEKGAHIYVCGDANRMAKDVHQALINIMVEHNGVDSETAETKLRELRDSRRYQRDVY